MYICIYLWEATGQSYRQLHLFSIPCKLRCIKERFRATCECMDWYISKICPPATFQSGSCVLIMHKDPGKLFHWQDKTYIALTETQGPRSMPKFFQKVKSLHWFGGGAAFVSSGMLYEVWVVQNPCNVGSAPLGCGEDRVLSTLSCNTFLWTRDNSCEQNKIPVTSSRFLFIFCQCNC